MEDKEREELLEMKKFCDEYWERRRVEWVEYVNGICDKLGRDEDLVE